MGKDVIEYIDECLYCEFHSETNSHYCYAKDDGKEISEYELYEKDSVPDWCPLRDGDFIFRLKEQK
jgi:hypothetical protein